MINVIKYCWYWILDLIYPRKCVFCQTLLKKKETDLCTNCRKNVQRLKKPQKRGEFFSVCVSPYAYDGVVRESLLRYKFGRRISYDAAYGRLLSAAIREELETEYDLITWVPLSRQRLRKRGYNQAKYLAVQVGKQLRRPTRSMLRKIRNNTAQSGITDAAERRANVKNAYKLRRRAKPEGKRILLIDDILTTGATLSECSRVLLTAGAADVVCATMAATQKKR